MTSRQFFGCAANVSVVTVWHLLVRYGDAVRELDHGVGVILNTVERLGLASDTLAVFSSDNGAATYAKTAGNITVLDQLYLSSLVDLLSIYLLDTLCAVFDITICPMYLSI